MKSMVRYISCTLLLLLLSCKGSSTSHKAIPKNSKIDHYSTMFSINKDQKQISVDYPDSKSLHIIFDSTSPKNIVRNDTIVISSKPKKIVCTSTTFLGFLKVIDETSSLIGFQNKKLVYDSLLYAKLEQNQIVDVSTPEGLNTELLLSLQPEIVFLSYSPGFDKTPTIERLKNNGIIVIQVPDWLEQHPLGRMEWVRFFSFFYGKYDVATLYVDSVISSYNDTKMKSLLKSYAPKVMMGLSFNDQWFVPSGSGYFGTLLQDAGFKYPFQTTSSTQSIPYSKEEILLQCHDADIWLNVTTANSLTEVETIERLAPKFKAFQQKKVYNYTNKLLPRGANDFWETGVVEPHIVLKDLIWTINNDMKDYKPKYYKKLQ